MWPFSPRKCDHADEIRALRTQLKQLDADLDDLFDRMKRLTARKGMQAKRDEVAAQNTATGMLPGETPDQWKQRMRKLADGGKINVRSLKQEQ